jgi:hypothetical protein
MQIPRAYSFKPGLWFRTQVPPVSQEAWPVLSLWSGNAWRFWAPKRCPLMIQGFTEAWDPNTETCLKTLRSGVGGGRHRFESPFVARRNISAYNHLSVTALISKCQLEAIGLEKGYELFKPISCQWGEQLWGWNPRGRQSGIFQLAQRLSD